MPQNEKAQAKIKRVAIAYLILFSSCTYQTVEYTEKGDIKGTVEESQSLVPMKNSLFQ